MKLYKLTDALDQTHNQTQWGEGVTHTAPGVGDLCGPGWIHAYTDPLLAALLNPIHGDFHDPHLWEAEGEVGKTDHGLKVGCTSLTTLRRMTLPDVTFEQRIRFGIFCALEVYREPSFIKWAHEWLDGINRSAAAAGAARAAARAAAGASAWASAAESAESAARAAESAGAAEAAARAAEVAAWERRGALDLATLAQNAVA